MALYMLQIKYTPEYIWNIGAIFSLELAVI